MPLQVRRGTDAERLAMTQPLASGELLYVTNDQKLYVGDGATLGGIQITGYTDGDAKDSAAEIFTDGTHNGIGFTYNTATNVMTANVNLSDYAGTIKADAFKGTFVGDDSTILVDGVTGVLRGTLQGSVTGNVTGNLTGNVTGNLTGNITGDLTGNTTGFHTGDTKGSVFAADSGVVVDSIDRIFYGAVDAGDTVLADGSLTGTDFSLGTISTSLNLSMNLTGNLQIRQITDPVNGRFISLSQGRGTLASPAAVQAGDELGGMVIRAYTNSVTEGIAGAFGFVVDSTAVIAGGNFIKSKAVISAASDTAADLVNSLIVDSAGVVTSNAFVASKFMQLPVYANDAARSTAIPTPAAGMLVFMTAGTSPAVTRKTVVYDGTAWVALH
jgi:hypothetical protein